PNTGATKQPRDTRQPLSLPHPQSMRHVGRSPREIEPELVIFEHCPPPPIRNPCRPAHAPTYAPFETLALATRAQHGTDAHLHTTGATNHPRDTHHLLTLQHPQSMRLVGMCPREIERELVIFEHCPLPPIRNPFRRAHAGTYVLFENLVFEKRAQHGTDVHLHMGDHVLTQTLLRHRLERVSDVGGGDLVHGLESEVPIDVIPKAA